MSGVSRGTYCLIIYSRIDIVATIGSLGEVRLLPGYYAYIGSALRNMDKRIKRHMDKKKKIFWHIDYLTSHKDFKPIMVYAINDTKHLECRKAEALKKSLPSITGFGASDCSCSSHLFYAGRKEEELDQLKRLLSGAGFNRYNIDRDRKKYNK